MSPSQDIRNGIFGIIGILVIAGTVFYAVYSSLPIARDFVFLRRVELNNEIVDSCGKLAASINPGEFIEPVYVRCLKDKQY